MANKFVLRKLCNKQFTVSGVEFIIYSPSRIFLKPATFGRTRIATAPAVLISKNKRHSRVMIQSMGSPYSILVIEDALVSTAQIQFRHGTPRRTFVSA